MKDGKLPSADGAIYSGQELVVPPLERCLKWCDIVEEKYNVPRKPRKMLTLGRKGRIDEHFQDTYDKLIAIRNHLDKLLLTKAWSLRETDLYMWHRKLDRIDDSRRDGNFFDADGRPADLHAQRVGLEATELIDD